MGIRVGIVGVVLSVPNVLIEKNSKFFLLNFTFLLCFPYLYMRDTKTPAV